MTILSSCYISEEVTPYQDVWDYDLPENVGLVDNRLLQIDDMIDENVFESINGLVIIRNDKLVFENYYLNNTRRAIYSLGGASMVITLAGLGVAEDKQMLSINDPIADYLPEYQDVFQMDTEKQNITIAHLMLHKSGFSWNENIEPRSSKKNTLNQMKIHNDWCRFILEQPIEAPAGLRFNPNTGTGVILAKIIENASGKNFENFIKEYVLDPLSITSVTIETDGEGNFNGGDGISINLIDWTKFGYLILNKGIWKGRKIISPDFILNSTSSLTKVSSRYEVGYIWLLFGEIFTEYFGIDHKEVFFISGEASQSMYIIPSKNMVVSMFLGSSHFELYDPFNPSLDLFAEITHTFQ